MTDSPSSTTFTWKIGNFSLLIQGLYSSDTFVAAGEKWKIAFLLKWRETHYLVIDLHAADWVDLPLERSRGVGYTLRVINQINPKKTRSAGRACWRFSNELGDLGFKTLIHLTELGDPKNGFLVNDTCIIEAVFTPPMLGDAKEETAYPVIGQPKMTDSPSSTTFTWNIKNFSLLAQGLHSSDTFEAAGEKWSIAILHKGHASEAGYFAIDLQAADWVDLPLERSRGVGYTLRVINQINPKKTRSAGKACWRFANEFADWGVKSLIRLTELGDPKNGFLVNDTCIIEAEITPVLGDAQEETVVRANAVQRFEIQETQNPPMLRTHTRTSYIAPPPANLPKPSSTLKNRSNIASKMLQVFMAEFGSNTPTYEKFGKVMEDLRASMYGGNMGDIFEEWRPHILEIEALLGDIEDLQHECKDEAPLQDELWKLVESLAQFGEASTQAEEKVATSVSMLDSKRQELKETQKRLSNLRLQMEELRLEMVQLLASESNIQEYISSEVSTHAKAISEKEEAQKEIKKLKQNKEDVTKNIQAIRNRTEAKRSTIAEKKALVQVWLSNRLTSTKSA